MNKKLSNTESEGTYHHSGLKAGEKTGHTTHNENSRQDHNANTHWMPGSCRSSVPENKYF